MITEARAGLLSRPQDAARAAGARGGVAKIVESGHGSVKVQQMRRIWRSNNATVIGRQTRKTAALQDCQITKLWDSGGHVQEQVPLVGHNGVQKAWAPGEKQAWPSGAANVQAGQHKRRARARQRQRRAREEARDMDSWSLKRKEETWTLGVSRGGERHGLLES